MASHSESPPAQTIRPIDPPPDSDRPTTAMLKADIDSGRTGDKVPVFDPGLSTLGTDDEAAGRPPEPFRVALARHYETVQRWVVDQAEASHTLRSDGTLTLFFGLIAAVALALLLGVWLSAR